MKPFKVVSDGTVLGTKIYTPEGEDVSASARAYTITHTAGDIPRLVLEIICPEIEVTAFADDSKHFVATGK